MRFGLVILSVLGLEAPIRAHSLSAECRIRDGKVEVEAFFSDDTPAADALVRVTGSDKKVIATGRTDGKGQWTFAIPEVGKYQLVVDAGDGHRVTRPFEIASGAIVAQPASRVEHPTTTSPPEPFSGEATIISDGPTRQEFTAFPWLKVGIGLGAILGFCVAFVIARRGRQQVSQS